MSYSNINEEFHFILFNISKAIDMGLSEMPIQFVVPKSLITSISNYLNSKFNDNPRVKIEYTDITEEQSIIKLQSNKDISDTEFEREKRLNYYKHKICDFNNDMHKRKDILRIVIHPDDYNNLQGRIEYEVTAICALSGYIEHLKCDFIQGDSFRPDILEIQLESEKDSIERAEKEIINRVTYGDNFTFPEFKLVFSRPSVYEQVVQDIEMDTIVNARRWLKYEFIHYALGDIIVVNHK